MTDAGEQPGEVDPERRVAQNTEAHRNAWEETIEEMKARAAGHEADGWETHYVAPLDTSPVSADQAEAARADIGWGLVHTIPDNFVADFADATERGDFPEYDVFRRLIDGRVFHLLVLRDPDERVALFVAGAYRLHDAEGCIATAKSEGYLQTWLRGTDGTVAGTFRHEEPSKFFPRWDDFASFFDRETDA
jgi:hypothetical protein